MAKLNKNETTNQVTPSTKDVVDTDIKIDFEKKVETVDNNNSVKDKLDTTEIIDMAQEDTTLVKFINVKMYHIPGTLAIKQTILNNILYEIQRAEFLVNKVQWITPEDVCITITEVTENGTN